MIAAAVLGPAPLRPPFALERATPSGIAYGLGAAALGPPVRGLRAVHSGMVGGHVPWLVVGIDVIGGVWSVTLR